MGALRQVARFASPVNRAAIGLFAWRHRNEILDWGRYAARAVPRLAEGASADVVAEGRLRARFSADPVTRDVAALQVTVSEGVAHLSGKVDDEVADTAFRLAEDTSGVRRVRDEMDRRRRRRHR
jgi:hypothetical protein